MTLVSRLKTTGPAIAMGVAAATTVLAILGVAGSVMSTHCAPDAVACGTSPAVAAITPLPPDKDQERLDTALPPTPVATSVPASVGSDQVIAVARNDMIISTFDMLTQPLVETAKPAASGEGPAEAVAEASLPKVALPMATAQAHALTARRSTAAVDNSEAAKAIDRELGGAPSETTLAYAPAATPAETRPTVEPAARSSTKADAGSGDKAGAKTGDKTSDEKAASDLRTVGGAGVNVRSGPAKSSAKLFALAGGTAVTVKEDRGGWLHIIDAKGRSGWAYKTYITP